MLHVSQFRKIKPNLYLHLLVPSNVFDLELGRVPSNVFKVDLELGRFIYFI